MRQRQILSTDGYAFLNIEHPLCAWATYRGVLVSVSAAGSGPGFVSVWFAAILASTDPAFVSRELILEEYRKKYTGHRVSRLTGMYCFLDAESAEQAATLWGANGANHFRREFLTELNLDEATGRDRLDSNWISYAPRDKEGYLASTDWIKEYWRGKPYPTHDPVWETLVEGRITLLGTEIRERAYKKVKESWPESLCLLEIARLAAWLGSDLGNISAFLIKKSDELVLQFLLNMRDADNTDFLAKLTNLIESGHPVNWSDVRPYLENGSFGRRPDMRPFQVRFPKLRVSQEPSD